jgi:hypothetical protein
MACPEPAAALEVALDRIVQVGCCCSQQCAVSIMLLLAVSLLPLQHSCG